MGKIGLQLYSVKELAQNDFLGTVAEVAKCGYKGVEFAGYFGTPAKQLRKVLDENGLSACGSHIAMDALDKDLNGLIEYSLEIGSPYIVCPAVWGDMVGSAEAWKKTGERLELVGQKCLENGILFGYHNHDFEFIKYGGKMAYDIMLEQTDPKHVFIELDTYWVAVAGMDIVEFMQKYESRIKLLHIKDAKRLDDHKNTEIGKGILDVPAIVEKGKLLGVDWFIVEQESFEIPYLQSITESQVYLRGLV